MLNKSHTKANFYPLCPEHNSISEIHPFISSGKLFLKVQCYHNSHPMDYAWYSYVDYRKQMLNKIKLINNKTCGNHSLNPATTYCWTCKQYWCYYCKYRHGSPSGTSKCECLPSTQLKFPINTSVNCTTHNARFTTQCKKCHLSLCPRCLLEHSSNHTIYLDKFSKYEHDIKSKYLSSSFYGFKRNYQRFIRYLQAWKKMLIDKKMKKNFNINNKINLKKHNKKMRLINSAYIYAFEINSQIMELASNLYALHLKINSYALIRSLCNILEYTNSKTCVPSMSFRNIASKSSNSFIQLCRNTFISDSVITQTSFKDANKQIHSCTSHFTNYIYNWKIHQYDWITYQFQQRYSIPNWRCFSHISVWSLNHFIIGNSLTFYVYDLKTFDFIQKFHEYEAYLDMYYFNITEAFVLTINGSLYVYDTQNHYALLYMHMIPSELCRCESMLAKDTTVYCISKECVYLCRCDKISFQIETVVYLPRGFQFQRLSSKSLILENLNRKRTLVLDWAGLVLEKEEKYGIFGKFHDRFKGYTIWKRDGRVFVTDNKGNKNSVRSYNNKDGWWNLWGYENDKGVAKVTTRIRNRYSTKIFGI